MSQNVRHLKHSPSNFQAAYDAEAKAVLRQVERDFAEQRSQIVWATLTAAQSVMQNRAKSVQLIRYGTIFGLLLSTALWWGIDKWLLDNQIKHEMGNFYYVMFAIFLLLGGIQMLFGHKILPNTDKPNYSVTYVHLDLLRETVTLTSPLSRYPTTYSFHSKSILVKAKLPAFRLPETETNEYRYLAERLQRKISALTGLAFSPK